MIITSMNDEVLHELALLRDLGYSHLDLTVARPLNAAQSFETAAASAVGGDEPWELLRAETHACNACRLAPTRTNVVFGVGNRNADLMFIGEAPGHDEDLQGEPFVGRAGQLLTDIIKAMKLSREEVYIANVIKCRPPENRNPEPDEIEQCRPFLERQIAQIRPKVIVTLGRFGLQALTQTQYSISAVRGQWLDYRGIRLMPTYHPAYLLRNPAAKKDVWSDMKKVMTELGIPV